MAGNVGPRAVLLKSKRNRVNVSQSNGVRIPSFNVASYSRTPLSLTSLIHPRRRAFALPFAALRA